MSVNETLANAANLLLYGAMAAYAVAFVAFCSDLAGGTARAARARSEVGTRQPGRCGCARRGHRCDRRRRGRRHAGRAGTAQGCGDRRLADRAGPVAARRGGDGARHLGRAAPVGQHVRVRDRRLGRGDAGVRRGAALARPAVPRHVRDRPGAAHAGPVGRRPVRQGRPAWCRRCAPTGSPST
nr:hypothetical protein [Angustibacter aerolatus]